ncbi:MAG: DUF255 domain-containing protein [Bacteroidota bacterium]|nr:DUF255 domain-containing protein [Bacteroidota bacterium]
MKQVTKTFKWAQLTSVFLLLVLLTSAIPNGDSKAINWLTMEQALKASEKEKKKVFIDVYTDWCGWCKRMDATTFSDKKVGDYVNKKYYAVKLDAESNKTFSFKGRQVSERQLAGEIFKVSAYPTTVYLDENFDMLSPVPGYLDLPTFDKVIKFYGEDAFKKQSWQEFEAAYKP